MWKDVSKTYNFLDIGFRISDADNLKRFFLFFPADLRRGAVSDLSRVLKFGKVLHAVFNEVVEVTDTEETSFRTEIDGAPFLMVHHLDPERDILIEPVLMENNRTGSPRGRKLRIGSTSPTQGGRPKVCLSARCQCPELAQIEPYETTDLRRVMPRRT